MPLKIFVINLYKRERIYRLNRVLYAEGSILLYGIQWQSLEVFLDNASTAILEAILLQRKAILIKLGTTQSTNTLRRKNNESI